MPDQWMRVTYDSAMRPTSIPSYAFTNNGIIFNIRFAFS